MLGNGHSMFVKVSFMNVCKHHPSFKTTKVDKSARFYREVKNCIHYI